jgi:hypothetical protein
VGEVQKPNSIIKYKYKLKNYYGEQGSAAALSIKKNDYASRLRTDGQTKFDRWSPVQCMQFGYQATQKENTFLMDVVLLYTRFFYTKQQYLRISPA